MPNFTLRGEKPQTWPSLHLPVLIYPTIDWSEPKSDVSEYRPRVYAYIPNFIWTAFILLPHMGQNPKFYRISISSFCVAPPSGGAEKK